MQCECEAGERLLWRDIGRADVRAGGILNTSYSQATSTGRLAEDDGQHGVQGCDICPRLHHLGPSFAERARHTSRAALPQLSHMRQDGSDPCLHDVDGACSSAGRASVGAFGRVTETGEGRRRARGLRQCLG